MRGDLIKAADDCVEWLDEQPPQSVVYASVGSVVVLSPGEVVEMAHGLASMGRPFRWAALGATLGAPFGPKRPISALKPSLIRISSLSGFFPLSV